MYEKKKKKKKWHATCKIAKLITGINVIEMVKYNRTCLTKKEFFSAEM